MAAAKAGKKKASVQSSTGAIDNVYGLPKALFDLMKANGAMPLNTWQPCERMIMVSMRLNKVMGGGLPRGMISTLAGKPGTGKSTTALHIAKSIIDDPSNHRNKGCVAYWDTEYKFAPDWASKMGLTSEKFHAFRAEGGGEATARMILAQIESGLYEAIMVDSVGGLVWNAENDADVGDNQMAVAAKKWALILRKSLKPLREHGVSLIGINHLKDKIGIGGGNYEPGGDAWNYFAVNKLRTGYPEKDIAKGILKVKIRSNKNQTAPVEGEEVVIEYRISDSAIVVDDVPEIIEIGKDLGVFKLAGAWYHFADQKWNGGTEFAASINEDFELYEACREAVVHALEAKNRISTISVPLAGLEDYTQEIDDDDADKELGNVEETGIDAGGEEPSGDVRIEVLQPDADIERF